MKLRTRVAALATAVLAALGLAASPAQAVTGYDRCEDWGIVCIFTATNGGGTIYRFRVVTGFCQNITGSANNTADSFFNKREGRYHVQFYDGANCTGMALSIPPFDSNIGPFPSGMKSNFTRFNPRGGGEINHRDRASSIFANTCCP